MGDPYMNERTKTGLEILLVAGILGVSGDILLRVTPWGLNVLLFNAAFAAAMTMLLKRHAPERLTKQTYALLGALVFFASMFVWRDAIELRVANTFAIIVILGVMFLPTLIVSARIGGAFQYGVGVIWAGVNSVFAAGALFGADIHWSEISTSGWRKAMLSVVRGVMIALPLLLSFGALFMAADAVYGGWVRRIINIDFELAFGHLALFGAFAWLSAGYLRGMLFAGMPRAATETPISIILPDETKDEASPMSKVRAESGEHPVVLPDNRTVVEHINSEPEAHFAACESKAEDPSSSTEKDQSEKKESSSKPAWTFADFNNSIVPGFTLGSVEVGVILGLVNLLFLSFVIFQVPYLFGGMDLVQNTPDFKLADYASRGFGELVAVSALVLPILLASHWLIKKEDPFTAKLFRILAGIQIGLLFVIMASAAQRLVLLTGNLGYGMTTVRLYPMIFMLWLAIVFVWFGATVLRGARHHFAWAALWSAFVVLGATHVLNPDAFIVRTNIALMQQGREFDRHYNFSLSADAVPYTLAALPQLSFDDQCGAKVDLHILYRQLGQAGDLRSLNISRKTAWHTLNQNDAIIHQVDGCPSWVQENLKLDDESVK